MLIEVQEDVTLNLTTFSAVGIGASSETHYHIEDSSEPGS